MTTTTATTLSDVLTYIVSEADDDAMDLIIDGVRQRQKALQQIAAASVRIGMETRIDGISPKYLVGMRGEVAGIDGKRAEVLLDEASTRTLRFKGGRRFYIPSDTTRYLLGGIPLSCCKPA
jgi:aspartokinase-like uncharacterized kinase